MRHIVIAGFLSVFCLLVSPTRASAQDQQGNVAFSYSILHDSDIEETFPVGWLLAVARNITPNMGIVGEVGGNYKSLEDDFGDDVSLSVHSFLGGLRFQSPRSSFTPFAQALIGGARARVSFDGDSDSSTGFAVQPGAGIDFRVSDALNLRAQADYRYLRSDGESTNEIRFAFGVVFGW